MAFTQSIRISVTSIYNVRARSMTTPTVAFAGAILLAALPLRASGQTAPIAGRIGDRPGSTATPPGPTPRLADGHPDLGNGKGSWNPRVIANIAGVGDPNRSPVERNIEVPFPSWAKGVNERRQRN